MTSGSTFLYLVLISLLANISLNFESKVFRINSFFIFVEMNWGDNFLKHFLFFFIRVFSVSKSVHSSLIKDLFDQSLTESTKKELIFLIILSSASFRWFGFIIIFSLLFLLILPCFFFILTSCSSLFAFSFSISDFFLRFLFFFSICISFKLSTFICVFLKYSCNLLVIISLVVIIFFPLIVS